MPNSIRPTRLLLALAVLAAVALPASGCGTGNADEERGRVLFKQKCGGCHTMAQAGTIAITGPDLDDAFGPARASGQGESTIEGVVATQIENPRPSTDNPAVSMPANIVTGQDAQDVAAYVARYAGVPGAAPPTVPGGPGAQVFADKGCGGCHTLAAASAGGVTGPDLDEVLPGQTAAMIHESIVNPDAVIAKGYEAGVMPSIYKTALTPKELEDLVAFLVKSTSGKSKSG